MPQKKRKQPLEKKTNADTKDRLLESEIFGQQRVVIEHLGPQIDKGKIPIKRVVGEKVDVKAHIFSDGHDKIRAQLLYKAKGDKKFSSKDMELNVNDEWHSQFDITKFETYYYSVEAWIDRFATWRADLSKKVQAEQKVDIDLLIGADLIAKAAKKARGKNKEKIISFEKDIRENSDNDQGVKTALSNELQELMVNYADKSFSVKYPLDLSVNVNREKALFSSWYELFPRSTGDGTEHGTFADCKKLLGDIKKMGFDVVYLPPIHPIGKINRKGKNNSKESTPEDPGSPWAIGSDEGGHKSIHSELGTLDDFEDFVKSAKEHDLEVALDIAFQCAPDHPYVKEHPQWFKWRPDDTVQYAENPPKKYEDILPLNFETDDWKNLWEELKSVFDFWIDKGVRIFRVDNPHTKPFTFWGWVISEIKKENPDTIFLAEAFTRPKLMGRLAKLGFDQSYTYFTWRNTKQELEEYLTTLTQTELAEYFRPNFWPNTPDILPQYIQYAQRPGFIIRLILAGTLSPSYGIYGPAYELCVSDAIEGKEEYLDSEKYEIKDWDRQQPGNIRAVIERVNRIRRENQSLQNLRNLKFCKIDNNMMIAYAKTTDDLSEITITVVNLDPYHKHWAMLHLPLEELGIDTEGPYLLYDLLSNDKYIWQGSPNFIELDPTVMPAHILKVHKHLRREHDFDYFM